MLIVSTVTVDQNLIDHAPKLKLICVAATGTNNIDFKATQARSIIVRNVTAYSTDSVAQSTFTHLLRLASSAEHHDAYVKSGEFSRSPIFCCSLHPFVELAGKTIGIIGLGTIGKKVAHIASAVGMKVVYFSTSGTSHCQLYPSLSLEELLRTSDVVSIHAPLNKNTRNLIGRNQLAMMRSSAFLINVGRGGIVDEAALAQAVDNGIIAGAGLDVYEIEPLPLDSTLLQVKHPERFSFSPHAAWASTESMSRLVFRIAENIKIGW